MNYDEWNNPVVSQPKKTNYGMIILGVLAVIVLVAIGFFYFQFNKTPTTANTEISLSERLIGENSAQISWNGNSLVDSTNYDSTSNACTATRYGMNILISPCLAQDADGKDVEQYVTFNWTGATAKNISWVFVYDGQLDSGKMYLFGNTSKQVDTFEIRSQWVNNYLVDRISSYTNLGTPTGHCDIGSLNNTQMYNVTRLEGPGNYSSALYCFSSSTTVNATAFRISGNTDVQQVVKKTVWSNDWADVTGSIQHLGYGLLQDNRSYYQVQNVQFNPNQAYSTKWVYTPLNSAKKGKWHILGYDTSTGLVNSITSGQYIYVDPWWDASWSYKKNITIQGGSATLTNFTVYLNVSFVAGKMKADFSDIRFLDSTETTQLNFEFDKVLNNNSAGVWVTLPSMSTGANTIYMYYGNPSAISASNPEATWTGTGAVVVYHFSEGTGANARDSSPSRNNGTILYTQNWTNSTFGGAINVPATSGVKIVDVPSIHFTTGFTAVTYFIPVATMATLWRQDSNALYDTGGRFYTWGTTPASQTGSAPTNGVYTMHEASYNGTTKIVYQNAVVNSVGGATGSVTQPTSKNFTINCNMGAGEASCDSGANTIYDEFRMYNVGLSQAFMLRNYQNSNLSNIQFGTEQVNAGGGVVPVNVTLVSPVDGFNSSIAAVTFNWTATAGNVSNMTLYIKGAVNKTYTGLSGNITQLETISFHDGDYNWTVVAYDNASVQGNTTTRIFTVDTTAPTLTITSPTPQVYSYNVSNITFSTSDTHLQYCWFTNNSGVTNISVTCGTGIYYINASNGWNNWTMYANDTLNNVARANVTFYSGANAPTITYNSDTETDGATIKRSNIVVNVSASDPLLDTTTIQLFNSTGLYQRIVGTSNNFTGLADGMYTFNATANNTLGFSSSTATRTVTIDTQPHPPNVTLVAPDDSYFQSNANPFIFTCNATVSGGDFSLKNMSLYTNITGTWTLNSTITLNSSFANVTTTETTGVTYGAPAGSITSRTGAKITATNNSFVSAINKTGTSAATRAYFTDASKNVLATANFSGNKAMFTSAVPITSGVSYYVLLDNAGSGYARILTTSVSFPIAKSDFSWVAGVDDSGSDRTDDIEQIASIDIVHSSSTPQTYNSTVQNFSMIVNGFRTFDWTCGSCDLGGFCGFAGENRTVSVSTFSENSQTYNPTTTVGTAETFSINMTYDSASYISATGYLIYNGTTYQGTTSGSGDNILFTRTINVPVDAGTKNFVWQMAFLNTTGTTYINSTRKTQVVSPLQLSMCNSTMNNTLVNFTIWDMQSTSTSVNAAFGVNIQYWPVGGGSSKINFTFNNPTANASSYKLCAPDNSSTYIVDADIQFSNSPNYVQNYHYYRGATLRSNATTEQKLYLLNQSKATSTELRVINEYQQGISNQLIQIQVYDVGEGSYHLAGMAKTNYDGKDIVYLNWLDTLYKFLVIDENGNVVADIAPYKVGSSPQTFKVTTTQVLAYRKFKNLQWTLFFNNATQNVVLTFTDPTGQISAGCLRVVRTSIFNGATVYDQCVQSTSGTLSYNLNNVNGTYIADFYAQGSNADVDTLEFAFNVNNEIADALSKIDRYAYALIVMGSVFFLGLISPGVAIVAAVLGWSLAASLGFLSIPSLLTFGGLLALIGFIVWKLRV